MLASTRAFTRKGGLDPGRRSSYRPASDLPDRRFTLARLAVAATLLVALAAPACRTRGSSTRADQTSGDGPLPRPEQRIEPGKQLRGTRTQCDEGPPSAESRAEWKRLSEPRDLESLPLDALAKRGDNELVSEVSARLLDEVYTVGLRGMTRAEQN